MLVYADLTAGATAGGAHTIDLRSTADDEGATNAVTAQGATSGSDITETYSTASASAMTVGAAGGTMEVSLASDNTNATLFSAGTDVELAAFRFYATTTEDVELEYLYLTQVVTDTSSSSYKDYDEIWFVDESGTEVAGTRMAPTSTKPKINFSDDAFVVSKDDNNGATLYLMADLADISNSANGVSDHFLGYEINVKADVTAVF